MSGARDEGHPWRHYIPAQHVAAYTLILDCCDGPRAYLRRALTEISMAWGPTAPVADAAPRRTFSRSLRKARSPTSTTSRTRDLIMTASLSRRYFFPPTARFTARPSGAGPAGRVRSTA